MHRVGQGSGVGLTLREAWLVLQYLAGGLSLGEAVEKAKRVAKLEAFAEGRFTFGGDDRAGDPGSHQG